LSVTLDYFCISTAPVNIHHCASCIIKHQKCPSISSAYRAGNGKGDVAQRAGRKAMNAVEGGAAAAAGRTGVRCVGGI
jgi:hypothetical protein